MRGATVFVAMSLSFAACEWNSAIPFDDAGTGGGEGGHFPDAPAIDGGGDGGGTDAAAIDAPASMHTDHLLLTEVALAPTGGEFIEIANPTTTTFQLDHYYLSDNGNYFTLPTGTTTIDSGDFIAQFPAGAALQPGKVITVTLGTSTAFQTAYGIKPTYSIADGTMLTVIKNGTISLTDAGEIVVLFEWDGTAPIVKDVDMLLAGVPTAANGLVSKSGLVQGSGQYAVDANTIPRQAAAPPSGKSTKRFLRETGHETQDGTGNGISGDDETSEDTSATWDSTFTAPTPGAVPAF